MMFPPCHHFTTFIPEMTSHKPSIGSISKLDNIKKAFMLKDSVEDLSSKKNVLGVSAK